MVGAWLFLSCQNLWADDGEKAKYQLDLEKIVVSPSRVRQVYRQVPENVSIVSSQDIADADTMEATNILEMLPSVNILEYGSYGATKSVQTRGASGNQVLTLVNGRPLNTPRDGITDYNQIPLSNIERIEVIRGPAAAMYGANAVGGVINIIPKTGKEKRETELISRFGTFRTTHEAFSTGHKIKNFDYFVDYEYLNSEGNRDGAYYLSHNANINLGLEPNKENRISVATGFNKSIAGSPGPVNLLDIGDRTVSYKKFVDLTWDGKVFQDQDVLLKLYYALDRFEFIEQFDPRIEDAHTSQTHAADIRFSQVWFDVWRTSFGANYQMNHLNSTTTTKHDNNAKALYVQSETNLLQDSAIFKLGLRWDDYSNFGDRLSPSSSLAIWLFDAIKFHGLWGLSFRAPTFNELYWPNNGWSQGNPNLGPELASSYEIGAGGYLFKSLKTDVTYFSNRFKNLIDWPEVSPWFWQATNIGRAKIEGIEAESEYIIKENLKLNLNYTYLEPKNRDTGNWLTYRPRKLFKCGLSYWPTSKFKINIFSTYKSKRYTDPANTKILKPYYTLDLDLAYHLTENCEVSIKGTNVLSREYEEQAGYPLPKAAVMGGVKLSF